MGPFHGLPGLPRDATVKRSSVRAGETRERLDHALQRSGLDRKTHALIFVDVDRFKSINDSLGHVTGDEFLVAIGACMRSVVCSDDQTIAPESQRKMATKVTLWGPHGRIYADRQEIQVYLRDTAPVLDGYRVGWNVRYTTELTEAPDFYLRGEEYSDQVDAFVRRAMAGAHDGINDFASAAVTDQVISMISRDAERAEGRLSAAPSGTVTRIHAGPTRPQNRGRRAVRTASRRIMALRRGH